MLISAGTFNVVVYRSSDRDGVVCTISSFTPINAIVVMPPHAPGAVPVY